MLSQPSSINANITVESLLGQFLSDLEAALEADILVYFGPIVHGADSEIRDALERRKKRGNLWTNVLMLKKSLRKTNS